MLEFSVSSVSSVTLLGDLCDLSNGDYLELRCVSRSLRGSRRGLRNFGYIYRDLCGSVGGLRDGLRSLVCIPVASVTPVTLVVTTPIYVTLVAHFLWKSLLISRRHQLQFVVDLTVQSCQRECSI